MELSEVSKINIMKKKKHVAFIILMLFVLILVTSLILILNNVFQRSSKKANLYVRDYSLEIGICISLEDIAKEKNVMLIFEDHKYNKTTSNKKKWNVSYYESSNSINNIFFMYTKNQISGIAITLVSKPKEVEKYREIITIFILKLFNIPNDKETYNDIKLFLETNDDDFYEIDTSSSLSYYTSEIDNLIFHHVSIYRK